MSFLCWRPPEDQEEQGRYLARLDGETDWRVVHRWADSTPTWTLGGSTGTPVSLPVQILGPIPDLPWMEMLSPAAPAPEAKPGIRARTTGESERTVRYGEIELKIDEMHLERLVGQLEADEHVRVGPSRCDDSRFTVQVVAGGRWGEGAEPPIEGLGFRGDYFSVLFAAARAALVLKRGEKP